MAEAIESHISFLDTTLIVYSRSSGVDSDGYSKVRMTFKNNGDYSSVSAKGKPSKGTAKWELSKDESTVIVHKSNGKLEEFTLQRINPNYLELGIRKKGILTVFKMVPEK